MKKLCPALLALCAACQTDETLTAYGAADVTWHLTSLQGAAFSAKASLRFLPDGRVKGHAPCNGFSATQSAPYPWFSLSAIVSTKRACNDLTAEQRFFAALNDMTLAEVLGDTLILSNEDGQDMVFRKSMTPNDG
ncbi:hypothetical protein NBRC116601_23740 [Cognatishimia sp. WU-CL00825]|uniref:META domain-containing protein n=1 Tax=Cognatishimia sp. WU-CL00825 TaxID=3127658 RepID=UPI003104ACAD